MRALRVVLFAEGPGETGESWGLPPTPGRPLPTESEGPAHVLIRRCLLEPELPRERQVVFEGPQREKKGSTMNSTRLLKAASLHLALRYFTEPPDLVVILVDCDGEHDRVKLLRENEESRSHRFPPAVIAVPIQEFESWLISDVNAVRACLETTIDEPQSPETMAPRRAKELLAQWAHAHDADAQRELRMAIVRTIDLERVAKASESFRELRDSLRRVLSVGT